MLLIRMISGFPGTMSLFSARYPYVEFVAQRRVIDTKTVVSAVFVAAIFMNIMDSTVVNVALPTLSRDFAVPIASVSGVATAYLVALAVAMPASGWVGDRFGARNTLVVSIGLFTAASALCGLATSLPELVVFRAVQGIGGGALIPVGQAMITRAFPPAERIAMNRTLIVPTLLAPARGPALGGLFVDGLSWRWIFYINLPVGVAAMVVGGLLLPGGSEHRPGRFDLPGFLLAASGLPLLMYALSFGATSGWGSWRVLATGLPGLALLSLFASVELRAGSPLLSLQILGDRLFRTTTLQVCFAGGGFLGTLFLVPLLLQNGLGFSAIHAGLSTCTEAFGGMTGVQVTSRLYKRVGPRRLIVAGMCGTVATIGSMSAAGAGNAFWLIPLLMFGTGFSFGFAIAPSQAANMATVSAAATGHAATLLNTVRQVAGAAGVGLLATVIGVTRASASDPGGYRLAFIAAALLMAIGALIGCRVPDADAAPTMLAGPRDDPRAGLPGGAAAVSEAA
jgi:EmrB/QacA subfamily drug resistance transporter